MKVVYVRNVTPNISEEKLKERFEEFGAVERVKKLKDYAFIHFVERENAIKAIEVMNNSELDGVTLEVSLAKPQPANKDRKRGGQSGYGAMNSGGRGSRGGPRGGGPPGRGRGRGGYSGGYGGGDGYYGYNEGYDRGYDEHYEGDGYGGGYGYRGDYGDRGYNDNYYDDYYGGGGGGGGYGGYGGYDRYSENPRSGPPRGRGGPPGRGGRGGFPGRGGERGGRGGSRGGPPPRGGRGGPPRGGPRGGGVAPAKRKYGADSQQAPVEYPEPKRRYMGQSGGGWGSQPIAQQPLYNDSGYGNQGSNQEWYSDSNWQQW